MLRSSESRESIAIVLAAGAGRRMGTSKLTLPWDGDTVIGRLVDAILASRIHQTLVVLGHHAAAVRAALGDRAVRTVVNPDPDASGMLGSVRCGLRAADEAEVFAVFPGDQPGIRTPVIDALLDRFEIGDAGIVVPEFGGRRGHPLLFAARYRDEILSDFDDEGLRGLLRRHPDDVARLPVSEPGVAWDLDRPSDVERFGGGGRDTDGTDGTDEHGQARTNTDGTDGTDGGAR